MEEDEKKFVINITGATVSKIVLIGLFFYLLFFLRDIMLIVLAAVVIASAIEPAVRFLSKYGIARIFSVALVYFLAAGIVTGVFYLFLPVLIQEMTDLVLSLPNYLPPSSDIVTTANEISDNSDDIIGELSSSNVFPELARLMRDALMNINEGFWQTVTVVFGNFISFILIMVLSFYLAVQEDGVAAFLKVIIPLKHKNYILGLWRRSQEKIGLWMQGQLVLSLLVGLLVYLCLMIFNVKHALTLGFIAAVFELIPIFGPIIAAIPAVLLAFSSSGVPLGLTVVGIYLLIQQFENHLFYPLVVKKIIGISPIIVILALVAGAKLAGFMGIILSVPVSVVLMEFFNDVQREKALAEEKLLKR